MTDVPPPPPSNYGGAGRPALPNPLVSYWKNVVLERYTKFTAISRAEFWWYFLANLIISIVFNIVDAVVGWGGGGGVLSGIYSLAVLMPGLAVGIRRLHDTDKSGWWLLLVFIPIVGLIVLIVFWATDGEPRAQRYGMSRSTEVGRPSSERAEDCGLALTAAAAERRRTEAAAAAAQLVEEREHDAGARHADRVTERDGAAVDVHDVVGDAEVAAWRPRHRGERLVDLE